MSSLVIQDSIRYYVYSDFVKIGYDEYNYSGEPTAALSRTAISGHLIIEKYFNGLPITNLSQDGFYRCILLTRLTIKADIKVIPAGCFADCYSLAHIDIPPSIETIEERGLMFWNVTGATIDDSLYFSNSTSTVIFQRGSKLNYIGPEIFGYIEKVILIFETPVVCELSSSVLIGTKEILIYSIYPMSFGNYPVLYRHCSCECLPYSKAFNAMYLGLIVLFS